MKSLFQSGVQQEILNRIDMLHKDHKPLWGTMNLYQMVRHCVLAERHYHGELPVVIPGHIHLDNGPELLRRFLHDDRPMNRNAPTAREFIIQAMEGDLESELAAWKSLISEYGNNFREKYTHWFFGEMTRDQLGQLSYKHNDHHLRQFGA